MATKSNVHVLGPHDTVSYADEAPHSLTVFIRKDEDTISRILSHPAEFEHTWQAAKTRKAVLASGKIDLSIWVEANPYTPPAF